MKAFLGLLAGLVWIGVAVATDTPSGGRRRGYTYTPNTPIYINSNGRNILIPQEPAGYLKTAPLSRIPVYRAEANPNQRLITSNALNTGGVKDKTNKKGIHSTLWANVGGDFKRTEEFMQNKRLTETQNAIAKGKRPPNLFDANGQTIRYGSISPSLGKKLISSSVPEGLNRISGNNGKIGSSLDVKNTDITKSYNQFGIKGNTLDRVRTELGGNVGQGTTYFGRRRSEPNVPSWQMNRYNDPTSRMAFPGYKDWGRYSGIAGSRRGSTGSVLNFGANQPTSGFGSGRRASFGGFPSSPSLGSFSGSPAKSFGGIKKLG